MIRSYFLGLALLVSPGLAFGDGPARQSLGYGAIISVPDTEVEEDKVRLFGQTGAVTSRLLQIEPPEDEDGAVRLLHKSSSPKACARPVRHRYIAQERRVHFDVCYDDLLPLTEQTVPALYKRLERSARRSCLHASQSHYQVQRSCRNDAVQAAVYGLSDPALLAYHALQTGGTEHSVAVGEPRRF